MANFNYSLKKIIIHSISIYRMALSPFLGNCCRFEPSCSQYAQDAIHQYGWRGIRLIVSRVLRCHPWHQGGVDTVPKNRS